MSPINSKKLIPTYKPVHVSETVKVAEIRDALNNLRYKVALSSYEAYQKLTLVTAYKIFVFNCFYSKEPSVIVTIPGEGDPLLTCYETALKEYFKYVQLYTSIVKAETKDIQSMDIYAEKVGYHHVCPECCATCRWCRKKFKKNDFVIGVSNKLECFNPKNCEEFNFDIDDNGIDQKKSYDNRNWNAPECHPLAMNPIVQPLGLCKNYESRKLSYVPMQGDSIVNIIDRRIKTEVNTQLSADLSTVILPTVGKAIEHELTVNPPIIEGNRNLDDYDNSLLGDELFFDGGGAE